MVIFDPTEAAESPSDTGAECNMCDHRGVAVDVVTSHVVGPSPALKSHRSKNGQLLLPGGSMGW